MDPKWVEQDGLLILIKGPIGCGKTHLIQTLTSKTPEQVHLFHAQDLYNEQTVNLFLFTLQSKSLFTKKQTITVVLENVDQLSTFAYNKFLQWCQSRKNNKLKQTFRKPPHHTLILTCNDSCVEKNVHSLQVDHTVWLHLPNFVQKCAFVKQNTQEMQLNDAELHAIVDLAANYYDVKKQLDLFLQERKLPRFTTAKLEGMPLSFRARYKQAWDQQTDRIKKKIINSHNKKEEKEEDLLDISRETDVKKIVYLLRSKKYMQHKEFAILDRFVEVEPFPIALMMYSTLPESTCDISLLTTPLDMYSLIDTFGFVESELQTTFWDIAIAVTPCIHEEAKKSLYLPKDHTGIQDFYQKLHLCLFNECDKANEDTSEGIFLMQRQNKEIVPPYFLDWDANHIAIHNKRASQLTSLQEVPTQSVIRPLSLQIQSTSNTTKRKSTREEARAAKLRKV
jgi:hypothetical protein